MAGLPGAELAIEPVTGPLDTTVDLPGSKSITNRALVCAALASGRSTLHGVLRADDTEAMLTALADLGVVTTAASGTSGDTTIGVTGCAGRIRTSARTIDARMSGTTARFLLPVLALADGPVVLTGHPQLLDRPMGGGLDALRQLGVEAREQHATGHLPIEVVGGGGLDGGTLDLPGDVSSQFLSGLLLSAPAMTHGLVIAVTTALVSRPYVDLTTAVMTSFGAPVEVDPDGSRFSVAPGGYRSADYRIEPDASAASYFFAAAAVCGGQVRVEGLGRGSLQGDLGFVDVLARMGCVVTIDDDATEVRSTGGLRGIDVDLTDLSDTAPTLAVVAAFADGPTRVRGVGFIRRKESDRIAAVVNELRRCGVDAEEEDDGFVVRPSGPPAAARIETYDDHRMAMSFAVLGLRTPGTVVLDPGCVAKTFPSFFESLARLR